MFKFARDYKLVYLVGCLAIIGLGLYAALNAKVQLLPNVQQPRIAFTVNWPGASESFLLSEVVRPYETLLINKLADLETLDVSFKPEQVTFQATFHFGKNLDDAEQEIRNLLAQSRPLPLNIPPIAYRKGGRNVSNRTVGSYFITSKTDDFSEAQKLIIERLVDTQIRNIKGVESINLYPDIERNVVIQIDPIQMVHYSVSYTQIRSTLKDLFTEAMGVFSDGQKMIQLKFQSLTDIEDIEQAVIASVDGTAIRLSDIANVKLEFVDSNTIARLNGKNAVVLRILRDIDADLIEVQAKVDQVLSKNQTLFEAAELDFFLSFDTSLLINRAVYWVVASILAGFFLSLIVSYLFLRRVSPTLFGSIVTLVSVSGTLAIIHMLNLSINVISLAGITFAIGMFVDGTLIVTEYIDRKGDKTKDAISARVRELAPALIASTLTSIVVFAPVMFNSEAEGKLFSGLAIAIVAGLSIALMLTLLLAPTYAYYFMKPSGKTVVFRSKLLTKLNLSLDRKLIRLPLLIAFTIGSLVLTVLLLPSLSYLPSVKRDAIDVFVNLGNNQDVRMTEENIINPLLEGIHNDSSLPEIKTTFVVALQRFVNVGIKLENNEQLEEAIARLKVTLKQKLPNQRITIMQGNLFGGMEDRNTIELNLYAPDKEWVARKQSEIRETIQNNVKGVSIRFNPDLNRKTNFVNLSPNRENLDFNYISEAEVKSLVNTITGTDFLGMWSHQGQALNAYLTFKKDTSLSEYKSLPFVFDENNVTYLSDLVSFHNEQLTPPLRRLNGSPATTALIGITDKQKTVSDVTAEIEESVLPELSRLFGSNGHFDLQGSAASLSKAKVFVLMMAGLIFIAFFVIITLVYKSKRISSLVLATLPFAITGGVFGFLILNAIAPLNFNILTVIGFIIMLGIVANNSILLLDGIYAKYRNGLPLNEALETGMQERLRPILMSTFTTLAGMLPLLVLPSEANYLYRGIAAVVVGGIIANLFSVFMVTSASVKQFGLVKRN